MKKQQTDIAKMKRSERNPSLQKHERKRETSRNEKKERNRHETKRNKQTETKHPSHFLPCGLDILPSDAR